MILIFGRFGVESSFNKIGIKNLEKFECQIRIEYIPKPNDGISAIHAYPFRDDIYCALGMDCVGLRICKNMIEIQILSLNH